jgi:hypothetical protein
MTEEEWFASSRPLLLFDSIARNASVRRQRLIAVAALRLLPLTELGQRAANWLCAAEKLAERADVRASRASIRERWWMEAADPFSERLSAALCTYFIGNDRASLVNVGLARKTCDARYEMRDGEIACLIRDVVGNPFRPITFNPAWRTSTAVALATQMYDSRDFSIMPILADALQDAGCDNDDILSHCRDPQGTHVRGCWVVDLVLGKS